MPAKKIENLSTYKWAKTQQNKFVCDCGCGEFIIVKWHHWYEGIPNFISGHRPPYLVDLGNGKTRKIWGGKFSNPNNHKRNSYYLSMRFDGKQVQVNLGTNLKMARKMVYVLVKAQKQELHCKTLLNLLRSVTHKTKSVNQELANTTVDRTYQEAVKAVSELRKTIKKKEEELTWK